MIGHLGQPGSRAGTSPLSNMPSASPHLRVSFLSKPISYLQKFKFQIPVQTHSIWGGVPSLFLCFNPPPPFPGAQGAGDLDKVTLEHGQRAEGQVLALLEGLLQLPKNGNPLLGVLGRLGSPNVQQPFHDGCQNSRGRCIDSGTQDPPQPTSLGPLGFKDVRSSAMTESGVSPGLRDSGMAMALQRGSQL